MRARFIPVSIAVVFVLLAAVSLPAQTFRGTILATAHRRQPAAADVARDARFCRCEAFRNLVPESFLTAIGPIICTLETDFTSALSGR